MKRLFFILAAYMIAASVWAEGHMKFKGLEITGTPEAFSEQLQSKGFEYMGDFEGVKVLKGDFAGYKDCNVWIISSDNEVVRVNVTFPERKNWSPLYNDYNSIKNMLTTKYGKPIVDEEEWQGYGGKPDNDASCMNYLLLDRAKIYSAFETNNGSINLQIVKSSYTACVVVISYFDNESQERLQNNAIDDL